jgi:predicted MFS family arabinose efflux permease
MALEIGYCHLLGELRPDPGHSDRDARSVIWRAQPHTPMSMSERADRAGSAIRSRLARLYTMMYVSARTFMIRSMVTSPLSGPRRATQGFFLLSGVAVACWAPMIPYAKARLDLDEARLGMLLLCMGLGCVCAVPFAGHFIHRYGNRIVLTVAGLVICLALPLLAIAPSSVLLGASLVVFGASAGVVDVAMNAHAVDVERLHGRPLMSGFHALFSIGGLVGSAAMSALLGAGAPLDTCAVAACLALGAIVLTQRRHVIMVEHVGSIAQRSMFSAPPAIAVLLGILCLILFLAEGAMIDWSAVFLRSERGFAIADAGLGYAAFSIAMAAGRLLGDRLTARMGAVRIVRYGSILAAAGFLLACALPWRATSLVGFVLVGIGASNIVPVLFSAAGRVPGSSVGVAIATVTSFGYAGMLAGPAVIGFVAHATSLPIALGGLAALLALVAACASIVARSSAPEEAAR